jgi:hypothetical protein
MVVRFRERQRRDQGNANKERKRRSMRHILVGPTALAAGEVRPPRYQPRACSVTGSVEQLH